MPDRAIVSFVVGHAKCYVNSVDAIAPVMEKLGLVGCGLGLTLQKDGGDALRSFAEEFREAVVSGLGVKASSPGAALNAVKLHLPDPLCNEIRDLIRARGAASHPVVQSRCSRVLGHVRDELRGSGASKQKPAVEPPFGSDAESSTISVPSDRTEHFEMDLASQDDDEEAFCPTVVDIAPDTVLDCDEGNRDDQYDDGMSYDPCFDILTYDDDCDMQYDAGLNYDPKIDTVLFTDVLPPRLLAPGKFEERVPDGPFVMDVSCRVGFFYPSVRVRSVEVRVSSKCIQLIIRCHDTNAILGPHGSRVKELARRLAECYGLPFEAYAERI